MTCLSALNHKVKVPPFTGTVSSRPTLLTMMVFLPFSSAQLLQVAPLLTNSARITSVSSLCLFLNAHNLIHAIGTSWYHSHYSAQYAGGALGPIVIHGPAHPQACYDEDLGPVMIGDWYHADYFSLVETTMSGGLPFSDNILINGKMNYPCENTTAVCTPNAGISKFAFTPGKKYRLRLINPSAEAIIKFHIDGHNLSVIANDFVPIIPYTTNVVTLGVGQRSDIIVRHTPFIAAPDKY